MTENLIGLCRKNALLFTETVCRLQAGATCPFPEYFDWADHIAVNRIRDYPYHLNKTTREARRIVALFKPFFKEASFNDWKKNWYAQTLAASWIHDIGMLSDRNRHGYGSAALLFGANPYGLDFNAIAIDDRIKIGLLCLRHNNGWQAAYNGMKEILARHGLSDEILWGFFPGTATPVWQLEFSGKIISTADSLRYRGRNLRNDLRQPFDIFKKCRHCGTVYHDVVPFCETINCGSTAFDPEVVVAFDFDTRGYTPDVDTAVYRKKVNGVCEKLNSHLSNTRACVRAREENQFYTLGDMTLFNVSLESVESWRQKLDVENIDYSVLHDLFIRPPGAPPVNSPYKTVVHMGMDSAYPGASFNTFFKYIAEFLEENLTLRESSVLNHGPINTLLHMRVSDGSKFKDLFGKFGEIAGSAMGPKAEVVKLAKSIKKQFEGWRTGFTVLPVEIIENRLEVIAV